MAGINIDELSGALLEEALKQAGMSKEEYGKARRIEALNLNSAEKEFRDRATANYSERGEDAFDKRMKKLLEQLDAITSGFQGIYKQQEKNLREAQDTFNYISKTGYATKEELEVYSKKVQIEQTKLNNMSKAMADARWGNVPWTQKAAEYQTRQNNYNAAVRNAKTEYDFAISQGVDKDTAARLKNQAIEKAKSERGSVGIMALQSGFSNVMQNGVVGAMNKGLGTAISKSPVLAGMERTLSSINKTVDKGFQASLNLAADYLGTIDARLEGSGLDANKNGMGIYDTIMSWISENFATSPYVDQKVLMQNVSKLVDAGIAQNVEQRALLETVSDKLVTTFSEFQGDLQRLIRIQQADLTGSQMGAEYQLNKFFNSQFNDTAYLTDMYDSVQSAILDATAQLDYQSAVGFNYAVQKWLGSLYELGMSSQSVSTIASGLSDLATGNVNALSGDSSMQTLFALSARNAGLSYTDLLTSGLNAETTNALLTSMVSYLKQIADTTNSNVVKSAWANISSLKMSDLRAFRNMTPEDIATISAEKTDYGSAYTALTSQFSKVAPRTSVSEWASNLTSNALLGIGNILTGDGQDLSSYLLWTIGSALGGTVGTGLQAAVVGKSLLKNIDNTLGKVQNWAAGTKLGTLLGIKTTEVEGETNPLLALAKDMIDTVGSGALTGGASASLMNALQGSMWVGERGQGYTPLANNVVASGTSYSYSSASGSDRALSLAQNPAVTLTPSTVSGSAVVREVGDIYYQLFEVRKPIRVILSAVEVHNEEKDPGILVESVDYLAERAKGTGINIDVGSEDVSALQRGVYTARYTY